MYEWYTIILLLLVCPMHMIAVFRETTEYWMPLRASTCKLVRSFGRMLWIMNCFYHICQQTMNSVVQFSNLKDKTELLIIRSGYCFNQFLSSLCKCWRCWRCSHKSCFQSWCCLQWYYVFSILNYGCLQILLLSS